MAASALDECVSKVDNLILEVGKGMQGKDVPRMTVDPDDPWSDIWNPPPSVYKVSERQLPHFSEDRFSPFFCDWLPDEHFSSVVVWRRASLQLPARATLDVCV